MGYCCTSPQVGILSDVESLVSSSAMMMVYAMILPLTLEKKLFAYSILIVLAVLLMILGIMLESGGGGATTK